MTTTNKYTISSTSNHEFANTPESYTIKAESVSDARHWIINHLDCSRAWKITNLENN